MIPTIDKKIKKNCLRDVFSPRHDMTNMRGVFARREATMPDEADKTIPSSADITLEKSATMR